VRPERFPEPLVAGNAKLVAQSRGDAESGTRKADCIINVRAEKFFDTYRGALGINV